MNPRPMLVLACALAQAATAQGNQSLWSNLWSNYATVDSRTWTSPPSDLEAADDFDVTATIRRVVFDGHGCSSCAVPVVTGATLRFYGWNNGNPGALLQQTFLPTGAPGLQYDPQLPATVDFTLPAPFQASGRHFVSLQLHFQGGGYWDVWVSGTGAPRLSPVRVRDRLANGPWTDARVAATSQVLYADLTFQLFGNTGTGLAWPSIPCTTWSELPTQSPAGANYALLRSVRAFAANDAWAVGSAIVPQGGNSDQLTLTMHWDGAAWTQVPSPSPGPAPGLVNCILTAVDGAASNDLWAGGTFQTRVPGNWVGQQVFAMHWDGQAWTVPQGLPLPNSGVGGSVSGSTVNGIAAIAGNAVWLVGDWIDLVSVASGQTVRPGLLLHWDGSALAQTILPVVTGVGHQYFESVSATAGNDVWVAGGAGSTNLPGSPVPVLFHFDGSAWTHTPCAVPNLPGSTIDLPYVKALAPNDVWVAGVAMTQSPAPASQTFLSHWNGTSWSLLPGAPSGGAVTVVSAGEIYAFGNGVWRCNGATWTQTETFAGLVGAGLGAGSALGPCGVFAVGGQSRIGQIAPFAARIDAPWFWRVDERLPSLAARAPGSLHALTPPLLGGQLRIALDDPGQVLGTGQVAAMWMMSAAPAAGYPAPAPFAFGGSNGSAGEIFLATQAIGWVSPAVLFSNGNGPAVHSVTVPNQPGLVGMDVFTQGLLLTGSGANVVFSNGLDLHLGL